MLVSGRKSSSDSAEGTYQITIDHLLLVPWCFYSFSRALLIVWWSVWSVHRFMTICSEVYLLTPSPRALAHRVVELAMIFWFVAGTVCLNMILIFSHKPSIDFSFMVFMWVFHRWTEHPWGSYSVETSCWCVAWVILFIDWIFIVYLIDDFSPSTIASACYWFPFVPSTIHPEEQGLFSFAIMISETYGNRPRYWIVWDGVNSYIFKYLTDKLYLYPIHLTFHLSSTLATPFNPINFYLYLLAISFMKILFLSEMIWGVLISTFAVITFKNRIILVLNQFDFYCWQEDFSISENNI